MFDSFRDTPSVEGSEFTDDDISDEDISCETPPVRFPSPIFHI